MKSKRYGKSRVVRADCFDALPTIRDESIDFICVDPPYGTTLISWDKQLPFAPLWQEYQRILRPGGVIAMFCSMPFTAYVVTSKPDWFKYCLVWDKNICGSPGLAKLRPMKVHEDIAIFVKPKKKGHVVVYNPQMEEGAPYARKRSGKQRCNHHKYGFKHVKDINNEGTRYPKSILRISRDFSRQQQLHPTQKPVPLLEWLIKTYSNPGDKVLDNCMGSGSTGIACFKTGRIFYGIERGVPDFDLALTRLNAAAYEFDATMVK